MTDNINMGGTSVYTATRGVKFEDGTVQETAAVATGGSRGLVQTVRVPYTLNSHDNNQGYGILLVTFPFPFADNKYTVACGWENVEDTQFNGVILNIVKTSTTPGEGPQGLGMGLGAGIGVQITFAANNGFASVGKHALLNVIAVRD